MTTLRQDPTTNDWVILAPERAGRPNPAAPVERGSVSAFDPDCPFCPGNEHLTPPEISRTPGGSRWDQRVFPNRYPALADGGSTERHGGNGVREMDGVGAHEIVVESARHDERLDEMSAERLSAVLRIWRARYLELKRRPAVKAVVVFRNFGERAGTSLVHPHSQILAIPVFPPDLLHRYAVATRYFDDTGHCVYLDLVERELKAGTRLVAERGGFVAVAPFASRVPFETWVLPRAPQRSFGHLEDAEVPDLAEILRDVLAALRRGGGDPDYNLVVDSAPSEEEGKPFFVWHIRLLPRITTAAGFEMGSGMAINTVPPEASAEALRSALAGAVR